MCTIKEKWESSSSNYQHTKSNILWEDWELSFCKLSVLIWAEDATRVCLVFRVALCGEKFSKKFIFWIINYWRCMTQWRMIIFSSTASPHRHNISVSNTNQKSWQLICSDMITMLYVNGVSTWQIALKIYNQCVINVSSFEQKWTMEEKSAIDITSWPFP